MQDFVTISKRQEGDKIMNRTEYKNEYYKEHYDRINLALPKGLGMSINEYLYALVRDDLATDESKFGKKRQGFNTEQQRMLEKWQVPKKYYDMIEDISYSKEAGYFIYLKKGYVNDVTGCRSIHCEKTSEVRSLIVKSHKK